MLDGMTSRFVPIFGLCLACASCGGRRGLERVTDSGGADGAAAIPAGTVVLSVTNTAEVLPPIERRAEATAVDGWALVVPDGRRSGDERGRALLQVDLPATNRYTAWLHVRWRDSCGNSVRVTVDDFPSRVAGQDTVFGSWHWVRAGQYALSAGRHALTIHEREDGVAVDQILLAPDAGYVPTAAVGGAARSVGWRQFGDDFARSPGHGMEAWDLVSGKWEIAFSLDPNRIPNQYSLTGAAPERSPGVALVKGAPWSGCRLAFSLFPLGDGSFGAVIDRSADGSESILATVEMKDGSADFRVEGRGFSARTGRPIAVSSNQWHRVEIERWGWTLRAAVDGRQVLADFGLPLTGGGVGLYVGKGQAVFDDVRVDEIVWRAEDGESRRVPWNVTAESEWYRTTGERGSARLIGRKGALRTAMPGAGVEEIVAYAAAGAARGLQAPGLVNTTNGTAGNREEVRVFQRPSSGAAPSAALDAGSGEVGLTRLAIRFSDPASEDSFRLGFYPFSTREIEDPADYLDFTPEEYRQIEQSPDADKLRREKKYRHLVGVGRGSCVWIDRTGAWRIQDGVLAGRGPGAVLQYWDELAYPLTIRMKVKLGTADSVGELGLYQGGGQGVKVKLAAEAGPQGQTGGHVLPMACGADGGWHDVRVQVAGTTVTAQVDQQPSSAMSFRRENGGGLVLEVLKGSVLVDDLEILAPRQGPGEYFYAFDRRETDWSREGGVWIDHGGIACLSGSNWISLEAPEGEGMLWNKRRFGPNPAINFVIEENTEWRGWNADPSHIHYPFDNVRVRFESGQQPGRGYTLEINAKNRSATVLYRDGKEVASVREDEQFPMRYWGGHSPYSPRRNSIAFVKRDASLRALINGREVLTYDDPDPIPVDRVGFGGYRTRVNFSAIAVRTVEGGAGK